MNKNFWIVIISTFIILTGIFFVFNKKQENNEVVFWTLQMADFAPYINGVISDFETENPEIKIKWVDVPFSEGEKRTLASVLSDNPPDLHPVCHCQETKSAQMPPITRLLKFTVRFLTHLP